MSFLITDAVLTSVAATGAVFYSSSPLCVPWEVPFKPISPPWLPIHDSWRLQIKLADCLGLLFNEWFLKEKVKPYEKFNSFRILGSRYTEQLQGTCKHTAALRSRWSNASSWTGKLLMLSQIGLPHLLDSWMTPHKHSFPSVKPHNS